jgi:cytidylate kinase
MTHELGTQGGEIAVGLAERFGLEVIHHELIEHDIAERTGQPDTVVHRMLEGELSLLERLKANRKRIARITALEILEIAAKGNALIRGWGASYLLRSIPHVVCVRVCAPMQFRQQIVMERIGLANLMTAKSEIEHSDTSHNGIMQRLFGIDWRDPTLYGITLNTARVPVADCVEQIALLAKSSSFEETAHSRQLLMDELILARIRFALERRFGGIPSRNAFEARVSGGNVVLSGATTDQRLIDETVRLLQTIEGVNSVHSEIEYVAFAPHGP